jgi:hypothetical protein
MQSRVQAGGLLGYLSLFTSLGTLLCCALPALFVLLGRSDCRFGSVVRALADYAVPTQELDVYYCGAPDRSQFLLRIPDRAQASCHDS